MARPISRQALTRPRWTVVSRRVLAVSLAARSRRAALIPLFATLIVAPAASGHGTGGQSAGMRSAVTAITPAIAGLSVMVRDYDDRLRVTNTSGSVVTIEGYEQEPYLSFRPDGVYRNVNSPATYLNDDRFGSVALPSRADANVRPIWERVSSGNWYEWHDHRIHWMSPVLPPAVRAAKDEPHHIFDWTIPGSAGSRSFTIAGTLDYEPPPGRSFPMVLVVPIAVLALLTAAMWAVRRRREDTS